MPNIELVVLNPFGTGIDLGELIGGIRRRRPGMPVLHIGNTIPDSLPSDVPTLAEGFSPETLLHSLGTLIKSGSSG